MITFAGSDDSNHGGIGESSVDCDGDNDEDGDHAVFQMLPEGRQLHTWVQEGSTTVDFIITNMQPNIL